MEKGQILSGISIEDISNTGNGIGRYNGMAVFVSDTVPGDVVSARVTAVRKNYAIGVLAALEQPSPDRIPSDCPYEKMCGGCAFRGISYEAELALKEKQVRDKLTRIAGLESPDLAPIIGAEQILRYRNKAQFPVSTGGIVTRKGGIVSPVSKPKVGFYARGTHDLTDLEDCLLQSRGALAAASALRRFMEEDHITAYDEKWQKGLIRHLIVKTAEDTGEVMVILVINGKGIPNVEKLARMFDEAIAETGYGLESLVLNIHQGKSSRITGEEYKVIAGKPTILSECRGLQFEVSPAAFYQVNPRQTEVLYGKVEEYAGLKGDETVFDLYCGVGTIGLVLADRMRKIKPEKPGKVYGIEAVKGAVIDANRNAVINGLVNAEFFCGLAEEKIHDLIDGYTDRDGFFTPGKAPDIVIVDPPRSGCDASLLETIQKAAPKKIIYVSCDAATLARDIRILSGRYELKEATPVDMFPRCGNVEVVSLLVRKGREQDGMVQDF